MRPPKLPEIEIPTTFLEPADEITSYSALIYGPSGVGKTTLASRAEGALFLTTEPGTQGLRRREIPCPTWEHILAAHQRIAANPSSCKVVVLDTIENAYQLCRRYIMKEFGADHLNMGALGFGQGKQVVANNFFTMIQDFGRLPLGFWCIAHSKVVEVPDLLGDYKRLEPNLEPEVQDLVLGYVSLVLSCEYELTTDENGNEKTQRVIRTGGDRKVLAKDRSGRLPAVLPLSYFKLKEAWDAKAPGKNGTKKGAK